MNGRIQKPNSQSGLVSIMVVGIIAVLITLVVLAFSRITNRDLRQSLDRQLSSQAAYAAETGLNDTVHYIEKTLSAGTAVPDQANCSGGITAVYGPGGSGSLGNRGATVTCVLIQTNVESIKVDNQTSSTTKVFSITNASAINTLRFSWSGGSVSGPVAPPSFSTPGDWAGRTVASAPGGGVHPAVLRVTVIPVRAVAGWNKRDDMMANARTYFFFPNFSNAAGAFGSISYNNVTTNGYVLGGACNNGNSAAAGGTSVYACNAYLNGLPGGTGGIGRDAGFASDAGAVYYVAIRPVYNDVSFDLDGFGNNNTNNTTIQGAQALVDITARGTDVLKRIQARVNTSLSSAASQQLGDQITPSYSLESADSICKLLLIPQDGTAAIPGDGEAACQF